MVEVDFGSKRLPLLLFGTSPFMGAGQFGLKGREWYQYFFHHPERMSELFDSFCEQGFPGVHVVGYPTIIEAVRLSKVNYPLKTAVSLLPDNWDENLELVANLEPEIVFIHGVMTDNYIHKYAEALLSCFQAIRDHNAFPGLATHNPYQTLVALQASSNPLYQESFGLLLPINLTGWGMGGSPKEIINLLQKMDEYPIMAMKTLAAGRILPEEALKFVFEVPQIRIAAIGMTNKKEVAQIAAIGQLILESKSIDE
jgi:hypothetical protein